MIGKHGIARALAMYFAGVAYARRYLTDGRLPSRVTDFTHDEDPDKIARVFVHRKVKLWHRDRKGYVIHDYLDWNLSASRIKELRSLGAERQRRHRNGSSNA
jgi:hypothetical protein